MTDRPFAAAGDPAVAPEPGYYPDPSIPGFVRYWGGSAWVPGTSRPAPVAGEALEPPRYATRRPAPDGPPARPVPPPVADLARVADVVPVMDSVPVADAVPEVVEGGSPAGGGDTGPVYFDQTTGGASFVLGPRVAEVIGGPVFRTVEAAGPLPGFAGVRGPGVEAGPAPVVAPVPARVVAPVPARVVVPVPPSEPEPEPMSGESGWQADPRAQRGLMETGDAQRWVSWGVLPEAADAREGRAEPEHAPAVVEPAGGAAVGAPAVAMAARDTRVREAPAREVLAQEAPVPAVLASGPVPVTGGEIASSRPPAPVPVPVPVSAPARAGLRPTAAAVAVPAAPLPAVRTVRETAVQPRPSVAAPTRAASRALRATRAVAPAGLGRRLAARAVDTAVLLVVAVAAGIPLGRSVTDHLQQKLDQARMTSALTRRQIQVWLVDDVVLGKTAVLIGILLFVSLLYEVLPVARTGQTFGKRLARIRVVDAVVPATRTRPSLGRSLLRWAVRQLGAALLLGLVWPVFDRRARRGWQDHAARTRVVRD
ncbi:RDD family protein [Kitasatospora sp. NPDC056651]|uniref:RDD family protein n=1 Tax=Kitasatospora sp. NPDC056651 TaxID=3345892 RepID=UPI0036C64388